MKRDIYIGVDGGGTKTKVRIEDEQGHLLGHAVGGPSNIQLSVEGAWQSILYAIHDGLKPLAISLEDEHYQFHVGMGLAGCEVSETYQAFIHRPHPFQCLKVTSDAHTACLGAHRNEEGAIIIVGTGVVGYQIIDGKGSRVSGWGFPHDDEGSGAWLGLQAARLTLQWLDHRAEKSALASDVFAFFNNDLNEFLQWANSANSTEFARLAPIVINHSQQEEIAAVRLMKKAAHAIDRVGHGLAKMRDREVNCCLVGGIAPFIEPWLSDELRHTLIPRKDDASMGAILMMRQGVTA